MNVSQSQAESTGDNHDEFVAQLVAHRHRIYAFIAKQLVNPADVEDVFQKTTIVLWRKIDEFEPARSFFHWACGVAFNEVRNFLTAQRRNRLHFDIELVELLAQEAREEGDLSEARLSALRICMDNLPARQQEILRRCYLGTETIKQVADTLGRAQGALYKQLARLRHKLNRCISMRLSQTEPQL